VLYSGLQVGRRDLDILHIFLWRFDRGFVLSERFSDFVSVCGSFWVSSNLIMVVTDKEVGPNMAMSGRGKYLQPTKAKNKWRRRKFSRRNDAMWNQGPLVMHNGAYEPPRLTELQQQNRLKTKRFYPRKLRATPVLPRAPRNTSSFIMRGKRPGGLTSLVSPVTPAILPTPVLSPAPRYREGIVDEVKKVWGVDGYGSMNGLIRLRSVEDGERDDCGGTGESESEFEQDSVQQLDQRIEHGLSRFEILYPSPSGARDDNKQSPEVRVEELENYVAQLEDENLSLKENLFLMQQELTETRRRLRSQEGGDYGSDENAGAFQEKSTEDVSCVQS
jgi:hypothetical protein